MSEVNDRDFQPVGLPVLRETAAEIWLRENQQGIEAVNKYAEENGAFSDYQRAF
jgi:post-segregation antitoxin (ccd killing protein)